MLSQGAAALKEPLVPVEAQLEELLEAQAQLASSLEGARASQARVSGGVEEALALLMQQLPEYQKKARFLCEHKREIEATLARMKSQARKLREKKEAHDQQERLRLEKLKPSEN